MKTCMVLLQVWRKMKLLKVEWIIDSAASDHYCNSRELFANFQSIPARNIKLGDNRVIHAVGTGDILVNVLDANSGNDGGVLVKFKEVLYVPDMGVNLLSVSRMVRNGHTVSLLEVSVIHPRLLVLVVLVLEALIVWKSL